MRIEELTESYKIQIDQKRKERSEIEERSSLEFSLLTQQIITLSDVVADLLNIQTHEVKNN